MKLKTLITTLALTVIVNAAFAKCVARWDFNNYDPENPTTNAVLKATLGGDGVPCYYKSKGTKAITDGTLGEMYVIASDYSGSDTEVATAAAGLGAGNYALAIPKYSHVKLPIPEEVKGHTWSIKFRFYTPTASDKVYRTFFNLGDNKSDGKLFINGENKVGGGVFKIGGSGSYYKATVTSGGWHTITVSQGTTHGGVHIDEKTETVSYDTNGNVNLFKDQTDFLLCADESGEDDLLYIDYIEFFDEPAVYEGKIPHYTQDGLTGEWTFPKGDSLKARVGNNLEKYTRTGSADFTKLDDCVKPNDGGMRVGHNNGLRAYHGLTDNASYTVVMDLCVPDNDTKTQTWHGLFQPLSANNKDAAVFFKWETSKINIRTRSGATFDSGLTFGEWGRVVITYANGGNKIVYVNGVKKDSRSDDYMKTAKGGSFLLLADDSGEDYDTDISYAAIYDRVLSDAEIAELHARPRAHDASENVIQTADPAGMWTGTNLTTAVGAIDLMDSEKGGKDWTRTTTAPTMATYVFDLELANVQTNGGTLVKNASDVATGVYGTDSKFSGSMATTKTPATSFTASADKCSTWGYWSEQALSRTTPHRVAVTWTADGHARYYADGRPMGQIHPVTKKDTSNKATTSMTFLTGLDASVTRIAAYDSVLNTEEIAALWDDDSAPMTVSVEVNTNGIPVKVMTDAVQFFVTGAGVDATNFVNRTIRIDYGDGTTEEKHYLTPGAPILFSHIYETLGTYTPKVTVFAHDGTEGTTQTLGAIKVVEGTLPAKDVLLTWPWQQNVYTNRFTIMCETSQIVTGLEVEYGAGYAERQTMTYVEGKKSGTYIYKAHITLGNQAGATIPYRLGMYGKALTYEDESENTAGEVKLWKDEDAAFKCAIWGDNQGGARSGDWDADNRQYLTDMFNHMRNQKVDFGLSSGDFATQCNYDEKIRPLILDRTHTLLSKYVPTYVAWGNHDYPGSPDSGSGVITPRYFESGIVGDPTAYGTCAVNKNEDGSGAYYLYRNNVLFIFIHWKSVHDTTKSSYGSNDEKVKTWLADLLATDRAKNAKFRLIVEHAPFWMESWSGHNTEFLKDIAKNGGVDMVFSGHTHIYERIEKEGIIQLTSGCAGALDHDQDINSVHYGNATKVGGHQDTPYLWARQDKTSGQTGILGMREPVCKGAIVSYGELAVTNNVLTYKAHGFNADGSYIGVFDAFTITSKVVKDESVASAPKGVAADVELDLTRPIDNAAWKAFKDAMGEPFEYDDADAPVVNVSKTEVLRFCDWLNGTTGTYRLPTVEELRTIFAGDYQHDVSEWTDSIDPATGWCRILGGNAKTAKGYWCREIDNPMVTSPDCHADYLGFRLVTGARPADPVDPWAAPMAALAAIETPADVYKWEDGVLVDISSEWTAKTASTYDVPVIFTGSGDLYVTNENALVFNAGVAAPNSHALRFIETPSLTVKKQMMMGSDAPDKWGWILQSEGTLTLEDVTSVGRLITFAAKDRTVNLVGTNILWGATLPMDADNGATKFVASDGAATLRVREINNYGATRMDVGADLTLEVVDDMKFHKDETYVYVEGVIDANGLNPTQNVDVWYLGAGTLKTTYFGNFSNSFKRLGVSNIVLTSSAPWRNAWGNSENRFEICSENARISSLYPWTMNKRDTWYKPFRFLKNTTYVENPTLTFTKGASITFVPNECTCNVVYDGVDPNRYVESGETLKITSDLVVSVGGSIIVKNGGTLDTNGQVDTAFHVILQDGATLTNTGEGRGADYAQLTYGLEVAENATAYLDTDNQMAFTAPSWGEYPIVLHAGSTLVKRGTGKVSVQNGVITGSGTIRDEAGEFNLGNYGLQMDPDIVVDLCKSSTGYLWIQGDCTIPTILGNGNVAASGAGLAVTNRFSGLLTLGKPDGGYPFSSKQLTLANGATLDLTQNTSAYAKPNKLAFEEYGTITVDLTDRSLANGEQVISWTAQPSNVTFQWQQGATLPVCVKDTGLYYGYGPEAQIGETCYDTLQEALDVGGNVTLLRNVTSDVAYTIAKMVVLDLNEKTITVTGWNIQNGGTLTVGEITGTAGATIANAGKLSATTLKGTLTLSGNGTWNTLTLAGATVKLAQVLRNMTFTGNGTVDVVLTDDEIASRGSTITVFTKAEGAGEITIGKVYNGNGEDITSSCKISGGTVTVTTAFGDILTEQPYYWCQYDVSYDQQCGSAYLATGGNTGNVNINTASPWGKALTVKSGKAGPWGNGSGTYYSPWLLGSGDWTLHIRAKMPSNLDKGVVISLGSCKSADGFMLLTRGSDAGVYLANTTSGSAINTLAISKSGLSSDYHDFTMVFTKSTLQVQLYIDGEAVLEGACTLSKQVTDGNWQLFSAHGGNTAVVNGLGVYIEEMRFWQKAWGASDIASLHTGAHAGAVTLEEDTDWSEGVPADRVRMVVDMNGHALKLPNVSVSEIYSIKNSASGDAVQLEIATGASDTAYFGHVISANIDVSIDEGTLKGGGLASTVTIGGNATLDENGVSETKYKLVMKDGATLTNTGSGLGTSKIQFAGGLTLEEGATVYQDTANEMSFTGSNYAEFPINLNGGTLVETGSGKRSVSTPNFMALRA